LNKEAVFLLLLLVLRHWLYGLLRYGILFISRLWLYYIKWRNVLSL